MPGPKVRPELRAKAYQLWRSGKGHEEICQALSPERPERYEVSDRTVSTWIKEFKGLSPETISRDSRFEWHLLDSYGIPWEASSFIMGMLSEYYLGYLASEGQQRPLLPIFTPTVREVQWWWRVYQAAPEIGRDVGRLSDIRHLANEFAQREVASELFPEPFIVDDLEARLMLKPWLDEEHHALYHQSVDQGLVPGHRESVSAIYEKFYSPYIYGHSELLVSQQLESATYSAEKQEQVAIYIQGQMGAKDA